ncbi:menaquinone biosynthetic enzyme MqnA/MqnD family protein [Saccharibacillus sp. JS10]|uniref:menaquinone biosynthetic enzyme MqnA/MqnD family protein n=1 Tax=Saccharibacillus sp. JS10 TaxID=2950552 RepID=UPI00210E63C1|nr:menaquinone biosynthesis protein [Saccharibacillus sp. JS10]MCQ4085799.1 menaquinone biosynthesis protein [Saccharibacillus sp. JS10]
MSDREPMRLGRILYTNVWPVYHGFDPSSLSFPSTTQTEVPAVLNRLLLEGKLDMSPVSSFAYATASNDFLLLPDLSVSADGPVQSILCFSRKPFAEAVHGRIALTNTSATSVNLLKIIAEKAYGAKPEYMTCEPNVEDMLDQADVALLIGDHAIRADWTNTEYIVTDLGAEWKNWTGKSMTFAVWTVSVEAAKRYSDEIGELAAAFAASKRQSMEDMTPVAIQAQQQVGGELSYWQGYFANLNYDLTPERLEGLNLYFQYVWEMGLLPQQAEIRIWSDNTRIRVNE